MVCARAQNRGITCFEGVRIVPLLLRHANAVYVLSNVSNTGCNGETSKARWYVVVRITQGQLRVGQELSRSAWGLPTCGLKIQPAVLTVWIAGNGIFERFKFPIHRNGPGIGEGNAHFSFSSSCLATAINNKKPMSVNAFSWREWWNSEMKWRFFSAWRMSSGFRKWVAFGWLHWFENA